LTDCNAELTLDLSISNTRTIYMCIIQYQTLFYQVDVDGGVHALRYQVDVDGGVHAFK
jgi:hypothetical protein